jgi:tetratricopeptide (TPR) repeat protein
VLESRYGNVSEVQLLLGNIKEAIRAARMAVDLADQSESKFQRIRKRTSLANSLHQAGDNSEADRVFSEAEEMEAEYYPDFPLLDSVSGFYYCEFLLDQGKHEEVQRRGLHCLKIGEDARDPVSIGLAHLTLAATHPSGSLEALHEANQAIEHLRDAGAINHLPRALLARGRMRDMDEVFRTAANSHMQLFLADYHLLSCRRLIAAHNLAEAQQHFHHADRIIRISQYRRRRGALEKLRAELGL